MEDEIRDFGDLPHECLVDVFGRLSTEERWTSALFLLCKSWFRAFKEPEIWRQFDLESAFGRIYDAWSPVFQAKMDKMLISVIGWSCGGLEVVRVRHCTDRAITRLAKSCPGLEVLSMKCCLNATDTSVCEIATSCPKLTELDISYCFNVTAKSLKTVGQHCPNIKVLRRISFHWPDTSERTSSSSRGGYSSPPTEDEEAAVIAKFMPNLKVLVIQYSKISSQGLRLIVEGCRDLEELDLFGCDNLSSNSILDARESLRNLKFFIIPNFASTRSR